jgi:hypothetical protein
MSIHPWHINPLSNSNICMPLGIALTRASSQQIRPLDQGGRRGLVGGEVGGEEKRRPNLRRHSGCGGAAAVGALPRRGMWATAGGRAGDGRCRAHSPGISCLGVAAAACPHRGTRIRWRGMLYWDRRCYAPSRGQRSPSPALCTPPAICETLDMRDKKAGEGGEMKWEGVCWTHGEDESSGTRAHHVAQLLQTLIAEAVVLLDNFTISCKEVINMLNTYIEVRWNGQKLLIE